MQQQHQPNQSGVGGGGGGAAVVPVSEAFWSLVQKADKKFSKIRHLPYYHRNREEYDAYFYKVFRVYTQVWKMQQENRQKLVESGLRRSEIGEIASRIAQLYFGHYMRTSQASYLHEAFVFYDAVLSRDYFNSKVDAGDLPLATKQLRLISRFLTVCLLLNRNQMVHQLLNQLRVLLDDCKRTFPETDFKEWKLVLQELHRFLKADTNFMNIRPLRYSTVLDPHPDLLTSPAKRNLRLRDAVLSSYHHNEVKFSELTLDTFRMVQCLEWEPSGSFHQPSVMKNSQNGSSTSTRTNYSQDIIDPTLPPNPRKAVLYRPSISHFLAVVATICEELPPDGVILIYLSASGTGVYSEATSSSPFVSERQNVRSAQSKEERSSLDAGCLQFGTRGNGGFSGINCIFPSDIVPFTRRPLFLVVDGDKNEAFEAIYGAEKGETAAILLSPSTLYHCTSGNSPHHSNGSLFTAFITAPVQAFCLLLGISGSDVELDTYFKAENLLSSSLNVWGSHLVATDSLHPVWAQILGDPFLRRLVLRFLFCRAVLALYAPTFNKKEFIPRCMPSLPESLSPSTATCQTVVAQIANVFGATSSFRISEEVALAENITHGDTDSISSS
ncbi:protein SCAI isoform X1 [Morus notabilis]|uniref:protein SCAI isoform X1 n=1 Tax=Morus notabilis TaxID=981085 RepID=UPI000CED06E8|nr:protein SCAI isoform X1 [Morus notabilis]